MAEVSIEKRFRGQCRLVKLLLWRQAESTDLDVCFQRTIERGRIDQDDEAFLRDSFALLDQLESGVSLQIEPTNEMVDRLQKCVIKLNSADSA